MKPLFSLALLLLLPAWENPPPMPQYRGNLAIHRVPFNSILRYCPRSGRAWACSYRSRNSCRIYLPSDLNAAVVASLERHELAHCSGWNH